MGSGSTKQTDTIEIYLPSQSQHAQHDHPLPYPSRPHHQYQHQHQQQPYQQQPRQLQQQITAQEHRTNPVVCAIDFGTTFTGYALSFKSEYDADPHRIHCSRWSSSQGARDKAPTAVLFNANMELQEFGFDALEGYTSMDNTERKKSLLFKHFKMELYKNEDLSASTKLRANDRNDEKPALEVFSKVLAFLKDRVLDDVSRIIPSAKNNPPDDLILWVITVPAIWDDKAKRFMREAAEQARMDSQHIVLALEPEAAALYCRHLTPTTQTNDLGRTVLVPIKDHTKYLVLDLGGGTVDMTVYSQDKNKTLREIYRATGGNWGGLTINAGFEQLLRKIFGADVVRECHEDYSADMLELQQAFEMAKCNFKPDPRKDYKLSVKIPPCLVSKLKQITGQTLEEYMKNQNSSESVIFIADKMQILERQVIEMYQPSVDAILQLVHELMNDSTVGRLDFIITVGGYSESPILQKILRDNFKNVEIISPPDPSLSVLKGAVLFGRHPAKIESRLCRCSYAMAVSKPFREGIDPEERKSKSVNGVSQCDGRLEILIRKGERVGFKLEQIERRLRKFPGQIQAVIEIFSSDQSEPEYTSDCSLVGCSVIDIPSSVRDDTDLHVKLLYAGTELIVHIRDQNSQWTSQSNIDFVG